MVRPGIEIIKRKCPDYWRVEDVYARLVENKATLFVVTEPDGFFVGEKFFEQFTKTPILNIWLMWLPGAQKREEELQAQIDFIARGHGCTKVRFVSPRPWESILKEKFKPVGTIFERSL